MKESISAKAKQRCFTLAEIFPQTPIGEHLLFVVADGEGWHVGVFEGQGDKASLGLELGNLVIISVFRHGLMV